MPLWGSLVLVATSIKYYSLFTINYSLTSVAQLVEMLARART